MEKEIKFAPGTLVKIRDREWVLEACDIKGCVKLRPLGGTDNETQIIMPEIEDTELESATFPLPDSSMPGNYSSALLLRDALRLKLTNAAGPFRSLGHVAVEPRSYQLVPLLMALKLNPVRLLIADDVGIGKTIEAGLIVKELLERGEITKFIVLCPTHLVEQWEDELRKHFNIDAVSVTARSISKLEREVPPTEKFFNHYPASVISLDYIKSDNHAEWFKANSQDAMIVVDEAHTCCLGGGKQLRYNLLKSLAEDETRNMLLLTATPHSGNENAFNNLISLLDSRFASLNDITNTKDELRAELGKHLVQRRRVDIVNYPGKQSFPNRFTKEITYNLTGAWGQFFDNVRKYCVKIAQESEKEQGYKGRMMWYATLALLRCISSSPAAARSALNTKLGNISDQNQDIELLEQSITDTYDGIGSEINEEDNSIEPVLEDSKELQALIAEANALSGKNDDPKLLCLIKHITERYKTLKKDKEVYRPVIFCKYIATAHYLAEELKKEFPNSQVTYVTGEFTSEQREIIVQELQKEENPILVATDCLSEGINLQEGFNAVIHYDLAWNPTRHEQREGRVDRFGQKCKNVYCTMLYGADNPVDGFIFNVILRKAKSIKEELGILVPIPENDNSVKIAIVKAALLQDRFRTNDSMTLFDGFSDEELGIAVNNVETKWQNVIEKEKRNRTIFAQQKIKGDEVISEWQKTKNALGDSSDVERFFTETSKRLNVGLEKTNPEESSYILNVKTLPYDLQKQFSTLLKVNKNNEAKISFEYPSEHGYTFLQRSNPAVTSYASYLLEGALNKNMTSVASRCGAYLSSDVTELTSIYLLRIRYQIKTNGAKKILMAEESVAVGISGRTNPHIINADNIESLLDSTPAGNLAEAAITREVNNSIDYYKNNQTLFEDIANKRAEQLAEDHTAVRNASALNKKVIKVEPCLPSDLIGVYVLLPDEDL